jgi:glycosyltransferase involved in cell wall biosynthesis
MKQKILWYSDFCVPTGFGNVAEAIVSRLKDKYDFTVLGINYYGDPYNIPDHPYYHLKDIPVFPAADAEDYLGRQKLLNLLHRGQFDILFILQDTFNLVPFLEPLEDARKDKGFKYVLYYPVDAYLDEAWAKVVVQADQAVAYTWHGRNQTALHGVDVPYIYHGTDTNVFYPLTENERAFCRGMYLKASPEDFIITNVNRNQHRKDITRTILAFMKMCQHIPKAKLYLHTNLKSKSGHDLEYFINIHVPPEIRSRIVLPDPETIDRGGVSQEILRRLYCCSDVVISTSRGEGWGLSCTEAMACGVPVVMPRHTSFPEIVSPGEERGLLADCNEIDVNTLDNERVRPVVSIEHLVEQVQRVYENPKAAQERAAAALDWVQEYCDWDKIAAQWEEIFES